MEATDSGMNDSSIVYVRLLGEGTEVFRPTPATLVSGSTYRLVAPPDYDQEDEKWEFCPGSVVLCEPKTLEGDRVLVAVATASA